MGHSRWTGIISEYFPGGSKGILAALRPAARATISDLLKHIWPAFLVASFLILYGIKWGLPDHHYLSLGLHPDENSAVYAVGHPLPRLTQTVLTNGMGLYLEAYVAKTLATAGGLVSIDEAWTCIVGRLVVWLHALGLLAVVYLHGRRVFDEWTGRLAAFLLAVLPGFVINSHYFKPDVPVAFYLVAALLAADALIETRQPSYVLLMGVLVGYATATKYSAMPAFFSGLAAIALAGPKLNRGRAYVAYTVCAAGAFFFGAPYVLLEPLRFLRAMLGFGAVAPAGFPGWQVRPPGWIDYATHVLALAMTPLLAALAGLALIYVVVKGSRRLLPMWLFLVPYYLILGSDRYRFVRYTVPLLPFAALFLAWGAMALTRLGKLRWIAVPATCAAILYALLFSFSYVRVFGQIDPRVQASQWIERAFPKEMSVAVTFQYHLDVPQIELLGYQKVEVGYDVAKLQSARSDYLILPEFGTLAYLEALDFYPAQRAFFQYVGREYIVVAEFENSQKLLGIDSKKGYRLSHDWLFPNPRITILKRRQGD